MKQHVIFAALALLLFGVFSGYRTLNPPPPADYKIVYLGSPNCGACVYWKSKVLPAWKSDPASRTAKLELARLNGKPFSGGYGRHDAVFREAFEGKRNIAWPSFVLYNHGSLERVYVGTSGWEKIEDKVRAEAKRAAKRDS
ncbi:MAG: hypothetical protein AAFZ91_07950 [Pseudomonadota bacterium]